MTELIRIDYQSDRPTVLASDLHDFLEVETPMNKWFPRMCEYGFTEGQDFQTFLSESTGGRPAQDAQLTIDMAKELCMIQRSEKGRQARQYFIQLEKDWNSPEKVMARALLLAKKEIDAVKQINTSLVKQIEEQKPKVDFAERVSKTEDLIDMGDMAKILKDKNINIGRNRLFSLLRTQKILMPNNVPYQRYIEQGYFQVKETLMPVGSNDKIYPKTYITGKGQTFLYKKLKDNLSK